MAVGFSAVTSSRNKPLIERWNGLKWSIVASPNPSSTSTAQLLGVSCSSATNCLAVGYAHFTGVHRDKTLIERWNGTTWSIVASPSPASPTWGSRLHAISCVGSTFCAAVGSKGVGGDVGSNMLVEKWNGASWSLVPTTSPANARYLTLDGVSCTNSLQCFAVGSYLGPAFGLSLAERWNGAGWSKVGVPRPELGDMNWLSSVSCRSSANCTAVGAYDVGGTLRNDALIDHWNGSAWSVVSQFSPGRPYMELNGVSCAGTKTCVAVGRSYSWTMPGPDTNVRTLAERWNGTGWSIVASPNRGSNFSVLNAVSCTSTLGCMAVGTSSTPNVTGSDKTLVERWNGTKWSVLASPNPAS
jgi:hypothetical protein